MARKIKEFDTLLMKGKWDMKCVEKFMVYCNIPFWYMPEKTVQHLLNNVESTAEVM